MGTLYNGVRFPVEGPDLDNIQRLDASVVPITGAMMDRGLQVDLGHFERMAKTLQEDMDRITAEVGALAGYVNIDSGDQVATLLYKTLGLKQARPRFTPSGDRETTDHEALIAIQHDHPVVGKILDYKELSKLRGTYVVPLPKLARRTGHGVWRLYPNLGLSRVPSGRYNARDPNLLAFPSRTKRGREIRKGFITDPGWVFLSVDESQIEVRICAHSSEDKGLIHVYENEEDVYSDFATNAFSLPDQRFRDDRGKWQYPTVNKTEHRFPSKTCFLAAIYDVSPMGLLEQMPVVCAACKKMASSDDPGIPVHDCGHFTPLWTEDKCAAILAALYIKYPGILSDRKRNHSRARSRGYVWDMWGRLLHVGAVRSVHRWVVNAALRETGNFPYQGGAGGTFKLAMARAYADLSQMKMAGDVWHPLLPIHDEILSEVREDVAQDVAEYLKYCFETCAPLRVPIKAEWGTAPTWGDIAK